MIEIKYPKIYYDFVTGICKNCMGTVVGSGLCLENLSRKGQVYFHHYIVCPKCEALLYRRRKGAKINRNVWLD